MNSTITLELIERFWSKVDKRGPDECWEWQAGCACDAGYGQFRVNGDRVQAHRFAWELMNGSIPAGLFACHRCDNPPCCNPHHLFLGTNQDNMQDASQKGRLKGRILTCTDAQRFQAERVREKYQMGTFSISDLVDEFDLSTHTVKRMIEGTWRGLNLGPVAKKSKGNGTELKTTRKRRGMSQAELAVATGLSQTWISGIECNRWSPTTDQLARIKAALNWPVNAEEAFAILEGAK